MARKTKRRTGRKSRRSIKRSIKRYLEKSLRRKSLRKKSLNKFNKRINKRKNKKTKKKKIQRGGADNVSEQTRNLQRALERVGRAQELSATRANLRSGQETGQTVEVPAGAGAVPESAELAAEQVLEPAAPVAAASTTTAGTDTPVEDCKLPGQVAELSSRLRKCEEGKQANIAALEKAKEEAVAAKAVQKASEEEVRKTKTELDESRRNVTDLELKLKKLSEEAAEANAAAAEAASAAEAAEKSAKDLGKANSEVRRELDQAAEAAAQAAAQAESREQDLKKQLDAEQLKYAELETQLAAAEEEAQMAAEAVRAAERAQEGAQAGAQERDAELEALNKQIKSLLKSKACSTIAEIIIDLGVIEDKAAKGEGSRGVGAEAEEEPPSEPAAAPEPEAAPEPAAGAAGAAAGAAGVGLPEASYGLRKDTPLKYIKLAVGSIAEALGYGDEVKQLYADEFNVEIQGDVVEAVVDVIDRLLNYIYSGNKTLIDEVKSKINIHS